MRKNIKKILIAVLILGLIGAQGLTVKATITTLSQVMSAGTRTIVSPTSAAFTGLTVTHTVQTATTSFTVSPRNAVGDGARYDVTMTARNLTTIGPVRMPLAIPRVIGTAGTYDGTHGEMDPVKRYEVRIAAGGAVGAATYQWRVCGVTCIPWSTAVATASTVTIERGISVTFPAATYVVNDEWHFGVDVFRYTGLTLTTGTLSATSGSTVGMTVGIGGTLTGPVDQIISNSMSLVTTEHYRGMGEYTLNVGFSQSVRANPIAGTYTSTATITIL